MAKKKHHGSNNAKKHHSTPKKNNGTSNASTTSTSVSEDVSSCAVTPMSKMETSSINNYNNDPTITLVLDWKTEGNNAYSRKDYKNALSSYDKALALMEDQTIQSNPDYQTIQVQLLSNRSLVLTKLEKYDDSLADCNRILETYNILNQPKIWFRRAVARDGKAMILAKTNPDQARELLLLAKYDLQECLRSLQTQQQPPSPSTTQAQTPQTPETPGKKSSTMSTDDSMKLSVTQLAIRIQKSLSQVSEAAVKTNAATSVKTKTPKNDTITNESNIDFNNNRNKRPSPEQQQHDILQLLVGRNVAIANHYRSIESSSSNGSRDEDMDQPSIIGEGFFVINWKWWCHWTTYTQFFGVPTTKVNGNGQQKQQHHQHPVKQHLLRYFPAGATIPTYEPAIPPKTVTNHKRKKTGPKNNTNDDDDSSTTSSSSSTSSSGDSSNENDTTLWDTVAPGPINNINLLLPLQEHQHLNEDLLSSKAVFYQQWYTQYHNYNDNDDESGKSNNDTSTTQQQQQLQEPLSPSPSLLRPNLVRGYHYEILPREVYNALRTWYGEVTSPICIRTTAIENNTTSNKKPKLELVLYQPVKQHPTTENGNNNNNDNSNNNNQDGTVVVLCNACRAPVTGMRCKRCMSVRYCNRICQESHWPVHKSYCKEIATAMMANASLGDSNNNNIINTNNANESILDSMVSYDGRVGLNNLGNTCFMNSAIQCLSHSTPLTRHFLSGLFKADLNQQNPLGTGGKLAHAYATVIKDLWWSSKSTSSFTNVCVSPTSLKRAIAMFAPRFAGYLQHDTQEFLAYLLDGLHEDMNRIQRPPYVEMPDVSAFTNMSIAAAKCWDAHKRRNDSVILDTFYGQFKSTCVCPTCNKVSVSFDAFNHVSLEIPQPARPKLDVVSYPIKLYRTSRQQPGSMPFTSLPLQYGVQYEQTASYRIADFRQAISDLCQIPASNIVLCEVYNHTIVGILNDDNMRPFVDIIQQGKDPIIAYEVDHTFADKGAFFVVTRHYFVDPIAAKQTGRAPQDRNPQPDPFGNPFFTSIPDTYTCKDVSEHIWYNVGHLVNQIQSVPNFDYRSLLKIRLTDSHGHAKDVFTQKVIRSRASSVDSDVAMTEADAASRDSNSVENVSVVTRSDINTPSPGRRKQYAQEMTSILPNDSDENFKQCLGDGADTFVFLSLEWTDPTDEDQPDGNQDNNTEHYIDEERFLASENHPSWIEAVARMKAATAKNNMNAKRSVTLEDCFVTFTNPERLDEHNMWYCSNCKEHVRAMKTLQLWRLPNILIVHLKRFEFKQSHGFRREKLDTLVDFPLEGLDMDKQFSITNDDGADTRTDDFVNDKIPAIYDCFAVTNHFGSMGFGHYTAFARKWNERDGMTKDWALFDDANVRPVPEGSEKQSIVTPAAYVLFYRRRVFS